MKVVGIIADVCKKKDNMNKNIQQYFNTVMGTI